VELLDRLVDLPKDMTFEPPPCTWFMRKIQNPMKMRKGRT
jgi:hypothetical protein